MDNRNNEQPKNILRKWPLRFIICVAIICTGIGLAVIQIKTAPKVKRKPPIKMAPLVRTMVLSKESCRVKIPGTGLVIPAKEIILKAQVSGQIIKLDPRFSLGGLLEADEVAINIDTNDYRLALLQSKKNLANAQYSLQLEKGHQEIARREWGLIYGENTPDTAESELALRKPHLLKAKAELDAARAEVAQAETNLARTEVKTPFKALVKNKYVDIGSQVSPQEKLADLVGIDFYWVQVSLPSDRLKWITFPTQQHQDSTKAQIFYRHENVRSGQVIRLLADLSEKGRMARLLVAIKDPLDLHNPDSQRPPLLLGEYVRVEIEGSKVDDVFRIPRSALRNDSQIWLAGKDNKLKIHQVETVWREENSVLIKNDIGQGDRLIISNLAAPVNNMQIRLQETPPKKAGEKQ